MALTPGLSLGPYRIEAPIGEGGMGQVFRARDTKLDRDVAIKILPGAFAQDADRLARFQREAKTLASLNHPHIAAIYGLEERDGLTALVMEMVEGEDLSQRIARGAMPIDEALPIAKQIAAALEAAHEQGIIHRDLKPANIKVRADGTVKVLDFGLAKSIDPPASSSAGQSKSPTITSPAMTQAGMIMGTAAYMSPEQAKGRVLDKRTDIWAFGVVLYEMLTGTRAFKGDDVTDTMARILMKEPEWAAVPATVPATVVAVMQGCLQKDRKLRLRDIGDVSLALGGAFDSAAMHAATATPVAVRRQPREYLAWGLAAVATLAAVGVSVLYRLAPRQAETVVRFTQVSPYGWQSKGWTFAVAPDSQSLAFSGRGSDGVSRLFVRRFDSTEARVIGGTDRVAFNVFWAPDGRSLGFAKDDGLYRVDLDGGSPRRLCDLQGRVYGATWGTQGTIVFASSNSGLLIVKDTGGTPSPVTTLDASAQEVLHSSPWFLPDGRHLVFLALGRGQLRGVVWAVATDSPARTRVVESSGGAAYADGRLLFTEGTPRRLVAQPFDLGRLALQGTPQPISDRISGGSTGGDRGFAVSGGALVVDRVVPAVHQLTWVDRRGQPLSTVGPAADLYDFALAPDGQRVAAVIRDPDSRKNEIWLFEPQREAGTRLFIQGNRVMWARDSRKVYFTSSSTDLRVLSIGASEATPVANPGGLIHFDDVTPDGRYFVLKSPAVMGSAVWIQRTDDPNDRRALVEGKGQFTAAQGRVSPDGRWLAFLIERPPSKEVFVQPFDRPGERVQVSANGGIGPIWRDDGKELYYEAENALMAVSIGERAGALAVGTPEKLFPVHTQSYVNNIPHNVEVAAHGQRFLVNTIVGDSDNVPLEVTLNWAAGLPK